MLTLMRGGDAGDSDDEQALAGALSTVTVGRDESNATAVTYAAAGPRVQDLDLSAETVRAELAVQQRMLAPTSCEFVFAAHLQTALGAGDGGGKQNLKSLHELREHAKREASAHPERWTNQHAAAEIDRIAAEREHLIQSACDRVYESLLTSATPAKGTAALEAMAQCRLLQDKVILPESVTSRLEAAYEQSTLVLLAAVAGLLHAHVKSALTPPTLLAACDPRWLRGTLGSDALRRLRQLLQLAERALSMASTSAGRQAELARARQLVHDGVAHAQRLVAQAAEDESYTQGLRARCGRMQLPQPEEWLSARDGARTDDSAPSGYNLGHHLHLDKLVGFVEAKYAELQAAREAHQRESEGQLARLRQAESSAGSAASASQQQLLQRVGALEALNAQQQSEIERLEQLLNAARVPHPASPFLPQRPGGHVGASPQQQGLSGLSIG